MLKNTIIVIFVIIIIFIIILLLLKYFNNSIYNLSYTISNFDNYPYKVHNNFKDKQQAADLLSYINKNVIELMRHLKNKYSIDGVKTVEDNIIWRLCRNYNSDQLIENSPYNIEKTTSYTKNKGEYIAICLRNSKNGKLHDSNLLTFVLIHELSHVACDQYGHPEKFWDIFKFLLRESINIGIWKYVDYSIHPVYYCNMMLNSTPL